jgi:hypothetical protein
MFLRALICFVGPPALFFGNTAQFSRTVYDNYLSHDLLLFTIYCVSFSASNDVVLKTVPHVASVIVFIL